MALRRVWEQDKEFQARLHGAKPERGPGGLQPLSHGLSQRELEERVRTGGRVASQSVENQMAAFRGMVEAAMAPRHETYFEHPDGRRVTPEQMEAMKNAGPI